MGSGSRSRRGAGGRGRGAQHGQGPGAPGGTIPPAGLNRKEQLTPQQESFRLDPRQHFLEKGGLWRRSGGPGTAWGQGRQKVLSEQRAQQGALDSCRERVRSRRR